MIIVGVTGSIASGKSFVMDKLQQLGYKIFSADKCVKTLYENVEVQHKILSLIPIIKLFDKSQIAKAIYNNDEYRKKLEDFIHPLVAVELQEFKKQYLREKLIFAEIPLLFESGFDKYFDFVVTAHCEENIRLARAKLRKDFAKEIYDKIEKIQLPQSEKIRRSDFIINTHVNAVDIQSQVVNLIERINCQ